MAANEKNVTLKSAMLKYRSVGATDGAYTNLDGVLRGLTITQDEPESNSIDAEFFDSPFYIEYTGNPVTINFEWVNFSLSELSSLIGGSRTAGVAPTGATATDGVAESWNAPTAIAAVEKEWVLEFKIGNKSLTIYRGAFVATLKKDEDGALAYACTITSLNHNIGTEQAPSYRLYTITGDTPAYSTGG